MSEVLIVVKHADDLAHAFPGSVFRRSTRWAGASFASAVSRAVHPAGADRDKQVGPRILDDLLATADNPLTLPTRRYAGMESGAASRLTTLGLGFRRKVADPRRVFKCLAYAPLIFRCACEYERPSGSASHDD